MEKTSPPPLFNLRALNAKRDRANRISNNDADFLAKIAAETMADRLNAITREFESAADVFSLFDPMFKSLAAHENISDVVRFDGLFIANSNIASNEKTPSETLPFAPQSLNLVTSVFGLHWMNNLPQMLFQIRNALKPDGLFIAALPGDKTLRELRETMIEAETELTGNVSLRVDPFGEVRQFGDLLQRAGFALPVVDSDLVTVRYSSLKSLFRDLRAMGATSSTLHANRPTPRDLFKKTEEIYRKKYADDDGKIRASFEIVYILGWAPHESQQKPLKPGSGKINLGDIL